MALDPRTVVLLTGYLGLLMALLLYFVRRSYPHSLRGLGHWVLASLCAFAAATLLAGRGVWPDLLTIVAANMALALCYALFYLGTERFLGRPPPYRAVAAALAGFLVLLVWSGMMQPYPGYRIAVISAFMAAIFLRLAWLLHAAAGSGFAARLTLAVAVVQSCILLFRAGWGIGEPQVGQLFDNSPLQATYLVSYALVMTILPIGLVLLVADRLRTEFEYLASHDGLTGILNRRAIIEAAEHELERSRRHGHTMTVMLIDLDHFKTINDTHGHLVGDAVLADFARRTGRLLRKPDRLGRYGGEEFVVLLPETGPPYAVTVAGRLLLGPDGNPALPPYTASIGVTASLPADRDVDALLARADSALYRAKQHGRNRVEVA